MVPGTADPPRRGATSFHLRPRSGWLNDPNGMVCRDGRWHVFFQHNPDAPQHDAIAWGHSSSTDLVSWQDHPVAFSPTPGGPDSGGCWSGVLVAGPEGPAAVYTGVTGSAHGSTVCLRHGSGDDLDEWSGPVVVASQPEVDGVAEMRDPFVFTHRGHRFALLGAGRRDGTAAILLYSCDDLDDWEYLGVWLTPSDLPTGAAQPADVWECPQLWVQGDRAALVLSLHDRGVLGDVVVCTGRMGDAGGRPVLVPEQVSVLDTGNAFYAPQLASDGREGAWLMGWVREDGQDPAVRDHAGCLTLPRRLLLDGSEARLVLDPAVRDGLELGPPVDEELPDTAVIAVGAAGAELSHPRLGRHHLAAGTLVAVDADVVEVYPATGAPATFRHDLPWRVAGDAQVREVLLRRSTPTG
ncbi:glycoside hydrolase family 32 protein [Serinicoccus kebangsaanensis]|uniref:glycoside hydrolase family 32 protein n=1 Tax=Serinicoccus kebangsaanensis TaxID=2602069 RepID=UPI00124E0343|nr:glycoside hydrolase family 32 protein [Serinicoccus kebangsaanensis]